MSAQKQSDTLISEANLARQKEDFGKALELLSRAKKKSVQNNWHRQHFLSLLNTGVTYHSMFDHEQALEFYIKAYNESLKYLGPMEEMAVLNNIAIIYTTDEHYDKAENFFNKAYAIALEIGDKEKQGIYATNLGGISAETGNYKRANKYFLEGLNLIKKDTFALRHTQLALAENYLDQNFISESEQLLQVIGTDIQNYNKEINAQYQYIQAKLHFLQNDFNLAGKFANLALGNSSSWERKIEIAKLSSEIYISSGDSQFALSYKDSIINFAESLYNQKKLQTYEANLQKFEVQKYQKKLDEINAELIYEKKIRSLALISGCCLVLISGWAIWNLIIKLRQKKLLHQKNQELLEFQLKKEKKSAERLEDLMREKETEAFLETQKMQTEIDAQNRKLTAKALSLASRNEILKEIIAHLSTNPSILNNSIIKNKIRELQKHLYGEDEWEAFTKHFEDVNQNLLRKLKNLHPILTPADLRFISFLYMNLSIKEIATILNITLDAAWKRKERITKKMKLTTSNELNHFISSI